MNIILAGHGKLGAAIVRRLAEEKHNITVIDVTAQRLERVSEAQDVMTLTGNGSSIETLEEAGVDHCDVFIAVTGVDELNLLSCMFAKKAGAKHTIARVRNPEYVREGEFIKKQLGISELINPDWGAAREISRLLRFPGALKIDTFSGGKVRMIKFQLEAKHKLCGHTLKELRPTLQNILICAVERGADVCIPGGDFKLEAGDIISFLATKQDAGTFFDELGVQNRPVKNAFILGCGKIGYFLAKDLIEHKIQVRVVEINKSRCEEIAETLPQVNVIHGDANDKLFLVNEGLMDTESIVSLTDVDEENILEALFARKNTKAKVVCKISKLAYDDIISGLDLGSTIYPRNISCDYVVRYVRALQNEAGNNIKSLYRILDDSVEALEFDVNEESRLTGKPLSKLNLKANLLVCAITRGDQVIIPSGSDCIQKGDSVIIVTKDKGLKDIKDILA